MTVVLKKTVRVPVTIPIGVSDKSDVLLKKENKNIQKILLRFADKLSRYIRINFIDSTINSYHNKRGKITNFQFHLRVYPVKGRAFVTAVEDKKLMNAVHSAIKKIKHQSIRYH